MTSETHHSDGGAIGFRDPAAERIAVFINGIGLGVRRDEIPQQTFLPGIYIERSALTVDETRLRFAGDLLHEAGHLAVVPARQRATMQGDAGSDPAEEMMAIAWSYAAALHIGIDPAIVFHDEYKGGGAAMLAAFVAGPGFGVPMLQWVGLAFHSPPGAAPAGPSFPHMRRWLREDDAS